MRKWTWTVGRLAGIEIHIHATFALLLAWIALGHLLAGSDVTTAARGLLLIASVFAIVVIHELGHALVARRFDIATRDITLYPIGGMARLERMPERPWQELLVAGVGPLINGVLALVLYIGIRITGIAAGEDPLAVDGSFAVQLMWVNISLALFNLLPAFPMDGGRMLRALLAFRMDRVRATAIAARIGRAFALLLGIVGMWWSPILLLIAVFVWLAGSQEAAAEQMKHWLRGMVVHDAMIDDFRTLHPATPVGAAAELLAGSFQHDFPVVDRGRVVGVLTRDDIVGAMAAGSSDARVDELMHTRFPTADPDEHLDGVLARVPPETTSVIVVRHDAPVGILDPAHLGDVLAVRRPMPA